jgi:hypothetical protein
VIVFLTYLILLILIPVDLLAEEGGPGLNSDPAAIGIRTIGVSTATSNAAVSANDLKQEASRAWQQLNTAAMNGTRIPPEMPSLLARILTLSDDESKPERIQLFADALAGYVGELDMLARRPEDTGKLFTTTPGPFTAGSRQPIEQVYTVGNISIATGGGLLLTQHWSTPVGMSIYDNNQGNPVTAVASNPDVSLSIKKLLRGGIHGGLNKAAPAVFLEVTRGELLPADTISIAYGGSEGVAIPLQSTDGFVLPVYVRHEQGGHFNSLPEIPYQVMGDTIQSVVVTVPSIVGIDEVFDVNIISRDQFNNKAVGRVPSFDILVDGQYHSRLESGYDAIGIVRNMVISRPGVHEITVRSSGGGISGKANPIRVLPGPGNRILWGELKRTTEMSTGLGSPDHHLGIARNEYNLDFVALTDSDAMLDDWEWESVRGSIDRLSEEGVFTVFPGYQRSLSLSKGGSQSVIFRQGMNASRITQHEVSGLVGFYQQLRTRFEPGDVLVIPNTLRIGDWRYLDPEFATLVEIKSAHGFFEWYGQKFLDRGFRVGFASSNDYPENLEPLLTGALTAVRVKRDQNTRDGIFNALKSASTYVTSGNRMILDFRVNKGGMGERVAFSSMRQISGEVNGTDALAWIEVIKNGRPIWRKSFETPTEKKSEATNLQLKVEFYSDSSPPRNEISAPRPANEWIGYLSINEGVFTGLAAPGFSQATTRKVVINPGDEQRIDFITQTRGNPSGFTTRVDRITEDSVFDVSLMLEDRGKSLGQGDKGQNGDSLDASGIRQKISLIELSRGVVERDIDIDGSSLRLSLGIVEPGEEQNYSFEFVDDKDPARGDYYYLRVKQQDDAFGWSSPVWVGGFDLK